MALHCPCSPSSSLLCSSLSSSSSSSLKNKLQTLNYPHKPCTVSLQSKQRTRVSVQATVLQETRSSDTESSDAQSTGGERSSSSKSYIWVNPKSPRASKLRQKSYDARYTSLMKIAESLSICDSKEDEVHGILRKGLGDVFLEQDAVVILNNMVNARNAYMALKYFQGKLKPQKEVILYNVTLKVFRKCRDLDSAENLQRITIPEIKQHPWFLKNLPIEFMDDVIGMLLNEGLNASTQSMEDMLAIVQEARKPADVPGIGGGLLIGGSMDFDDIEADIDDIEMSRDFVCAI